MYYDGYWGARWICLGRRCNVKGSPETTSIIANIFLWIIKNFAECRHIDLLLENERSEKKARVRGKSYWKGIHKFNCVPFVATRHFDKGFFYLWILFTFECCFYIMLWFWFFFWDRVFYIEQAFQPIQVEVCKFVWFGVYIWNKDDLLTFGSVWKWTDFFFIDKK